MKTNEKVKPAFVKQVGATRAVVWANGNEERTFFNISLTRRYRDGDQWKESTSFNGLGDVACLKEALIHVANWLSQADDEINNGGEE